MKPDQQIREGETCPTCGSQVTVASSDEGTSYYEPQSKEAAIREALKEFFLWKHEKEDVTFTEYGIHIEQVEAFLKEYLK